MHETILRITNISKEPKTIALQDILDKKHLLEQGIMYNYQGKTTEIDISILVKNIHFSSPNVFNSINEIKFPSIQINHFKSKMTDKCVKIVLENPINIADLVFVLNPINHVVITIFQASTTSRKNGICSPKEGLE